MAYTDKQIEFLYKSKQDGKLTWEEIREEFNDKFEQKKTVNALEHAYRKYANDFDGAPEVLISNIRKSHSARKSKNLTAKENRAILDYLDERDDFLSSFKLVLKQNPLKVYKSKYKNKPKSKTNRAVVMHLSDTHFQAMIDSEELGGANQYTSVEEARRLAFFVKETIEYKKEHRKNTELVLVCNGDLGQGIIHNPESTVPMTTQFAAILHLMTQAISLLSAEFKSVRVVMTTGNHLRFMHKDNKGRQSSQKWDGFHTIIHVALKHALKEHKNVQFEIPVTPYAYITILGHKFFIAHGDTVINPGIVGKTISSENIKNKINDLKDGIGPIDVVMLGHVHVATFQTLNNGTHMLVNGCMSGVDGFAQSIGIIKSQPTQQLLEVTQEHPVGDVRFVRLNTADNDSKLDKLIKPFKGKF